MQIDLNKEDVEVMNPTVLARMVQQQPAMVQASDVIREAAAAAAERANRSLEGDDDENVRIEVSSHHCRRQSQLHRLSRRPGFVYQQTQKKHLIKSYTSTLVISKEQPLKIETLLFFGPHFQKGRKIIICVAFFSKFCQNSTLYNSTPLTQSPCSAFILHTEMGIISKVKMGLRSKGNKI